MLEKQVENKIRRFLDHQGAYHIKHFGCGFTKSGVPDLICCLNGKFIGIEVKREKGGKLSEDQEKHLQLIKDAGGISLMARSLEEVIYYLTSLGIELKPPKGRKRNAR